MPYSLIDDMLGRDPRWTALAGGKRAVRNELQATYLRMCCESASYLQDGYLTGEQALECADGRPETVELLSTAVLGEKPFLHRPGQECGVRNCLDDFGPWRDGFDYRICGYLKRNPSRGEYRRNQAQKADSRDPRLRALVYDRDGGCCRYCRSGPLKKRGMGRARDRRRVLQYDHPDPEQRATPPGQPEGSNYVVACARCNELKGRRTPDEAGLLLLPAPTTDEVAAWQHRGEAQFDLPPDKDNDNARDKRQDKQHDKQPSVVPLSVRSSVDGGTPGPETELEGQRQATELSAQGSGSGRGGPPFAVDVPADPDLPDRSPEAPDPYTRRSRRAGKQ